MKNMMIYLKNMAGYKMNYFKGISYDEIRPIFEEEYNKIQTLFKKDTEVEKTMTKKVAEETLLQESFKKLRATEASRSEPIQEQQTEESQELSEEELQKLLVTVPVEEIYVEALQVKYPIINWEVYTEESRVYWKIIRVGDHIKAYQTFADMLKKFDRDDLEKLWKLHITPTKVPQGEEQSQESSEVYLDALNTTKILVDISRERVKTYKSYTRRSTNSSRDSTAGGLFSTAEEILSTDERIAQKLNEEEMAKAAAREEHERIDFEKALELQKYIVAEQVQERQSDTIKRYQTLKKKPVSVAQARKNMMIYLKNMAGYKMGYFKGMSYDEIRPMFEEEYNKIQTLFKKDTKVEKTKTKRVAEETLLQESFKKLRTAEASSSEPIQEQPTEEPKELSEEELKKMLEIVPVEEIKAEALQVKYPIINWEIHTEGSRKYWKIIRVRNITEAYQVFEDMLKGFDREDLVTLWSLVKERFRSAEPTEDMERALWVELKRLFEPDKDDVLWKLQKYMHDPLTWRLYDTCGVHHVSSTRGHDIYMLTEKDYPLSTTVMGLMLSRRLQVEEDSKMARDLVMKIFIEANKPRS
ncbi:hypothetical protein Tco_1377266 [Tanacetum coccineum]